MSPRSTNDCWSLKRDIIPCRKHNPQSIFLHKICGIFFSKNLPKKRSRIVHHGINSLVDMERKISSPSRSKLATGLQDKNISPISFNKLSSSSSSVTVSKQVKYQGSLIETAFQLAKRNINPQDLKLMNKPE